MIKKFLTQFFTQKITEKDIECSIDKNIVDCSKLDDDLAYVGVPAPILNPVDEWFSSPYGCPSAITQKQKEYQEFDVFKEEAIKYYSKEPDNIHQVMYDIATKTKRTNLDTDPISGSENFQTGSENI